mgnify:CR=1 FL=1
MDILKAFTPWALAIGGLLVGASVADFFDLPSLITALLMIGAAMAGFVSALFIPKLWE